MSPDSRPKLADRARFLSDLVIVDGFTRSGKFLVAHVVSALEGMEFFQYPYLLETLQYLHRHGQIPFETARALLHGDFDNHAFNMAVGRGLNSRESDLSCINKAVDPAEYHARAGEKDEAALIERWRREKRLPVMIGHEGLCNASFTFGVFPNVKIVNMIRDPVSLIHSWKQRGWGNRWGKDPKALSLVFQGPSADRPVPWFAVGWEKEYFELPELERIVRSFEALNSMARKGFEGLSAEQRKAILFLSFENLQEDPVRETRRLTSHLGRAPREGIDRIYSRERLPRPVDPTEVGAKFTELKGRLSPASLAVVEQLRAEYESYWKPLAQNG